MSLLNGNVGNLLTQAAGGFLSKVFGTNNRSPLGDCQAQVGLQGYDGTIRQYPHCAGILASAGISQATPATPLVPLTPNPPVRMDSGFTNAAYVTQVGLPSVVTDTLRALPGAGTVARTAGTALKAVGALSKRYPSAAGIAAGFLIDAAGNFIADRFGRLVPAKRHRRINPLNHRALTRALRRVKAARKICQRIEHELPKRHSHRPARSCKKSCR